MAESTEVVVWRFTQVIDVSLQIQGLVKVDQTLNDHVFIDEAPVRSLPRLYDVLHSEQLALLLSVALMVNNFHTPLQWDMLTTLKLRTIICTVIFSTTFRYSLYSRIIAPRRQTMRNVNSVTTCTHSTAFSQLTLSRRLTGPGYSLTLIGTSVNHLVGTCLLYKNQG